LGCVALNAATMDMDLREENEEGGVVEVAPLKERVE
jgi:hypothetical protein